MAEQRVIRRYPVRPADERWEGRVEPDGREQPRRWTGPHVESVIQQMDRDLGAVDEAAYRITE